MASSERIDAWWARLRSLRTVGLDTNVIIYKIQGVGRYRQLVEPLFRLITEGRLTAIISRIVEMEALVKPLHDNDAAAVDVLTLFMNRTPNLKVRDVDRGVARRAADIRARTGLRAPDAIIAATAVEERCEALIGNDAELASRMFGLPYLYLGHYLG